MSSDITLCLDTCTEGQLNSNSKNTDEQINHVTLDDEIYSYAPVSSVDNDVYTVTTPGAEPEIVFRKRTICAIFKHSGVALTIKSTGLNYRYIKNNGTWAKWTVCGYLDDPTWSLGPLEKLSLEQWISFQGIVIVTKGAITKTDFKLQVTLSHWHDNPNSEWETWEMNNAKYSHYLKAPPKKSSTSVDVYHDNPLSIKANPSQLSDNHINISRDNLELQPYELKNQFTNSYNFLRPGIFSNDSASLPQDCPFYLNYINQNKLHRNDLNLLNNNNFSIDSSLPYSINTSQNSIPYLQSKRGLSLKYKDENIYSTLFTSSRADSKACLADESLKGENDWLQPMYQSFSDRTYDDRYLKSSPTANFRNLQTPYVTDGSICFDYSVKSVSDLSTIDPRHRYTDVLYTEHSNYSANCSQNELCKVNKFNKYPFATHNLDIVGDLHTSALSTSTRNSLSQQRFDPSYYNSYDTPKNSNSLHEVLRRYNSYLPDSEVYPTPENSAKILKINRNVTPMQRALDIGKPVRNSALPITPPWCTDQSSIIKGTPRRIAQKLARLTPQRIKAHLKERTSSNHINKNCELYPYKSKTNKMREAFKFVCTTTGKTENKDTSMSHSVTMLSEHLKQKRNIYRRHKLDSFEERFLRRGPYYKESIFPPDTSKLFESVDKDELEQYANPAPMIMNKSPTVLTKRVNDISMRNSHHRCSSTSRTCNLNCFGWNSSPADIIPNKSSETSGSIIFAGSRSPDNKKINNADINGFSDSGEVEKNKKSHEITYTNEMINQIKQRRKPYNINLDSWNALYELISSGSKKHKKYYLFSIRLIDQTQFFHATITLPYRELVAPDVAYKEDKLCALPEGVSSLITTYTPGIQLFYGLLRTLRQALVDKNTPEITLQKINIIPETKSLRTQGRIRGIRAHILSKQPFNYLVHRVVKVQRDCIFALNDGILTDPNNLTCLAGPNHNWLPKVTNTVDIIESKKYDVSKNTTKYNSGYDHDGSMWPIGDYYGESVNNLSDNCWYDPRLNLTYELNNTKLQMWETEFPTNDIIGGYTS